LTKASDLEFQQYRNRIVHFALPRNGDGTRNCHNQTPSPRLVFGENAYRECLDDVLEIEETEMNRQIIMVAAALVATPILGGALAPPAWSAPKGVLAMLDPDKDGTVDLAEAKTAGSAAFDRLEKDHDGTLDHSELRGRLTAKDMAAADPDKDGTVDKAEYLALVEQRFRAADPDNDGTVDASELRSPAGQALVRLLK
jgi:EF hand